MNQRLSDLMAPGEIWISEYGVEWVIFGVDDTWADVKRVGGRTIHRVMGDEIAHWERSAQGKERDD